MIPSRERPPRRSRSWSGIFRAQYRLLRWFDPVLHAWWRRFGIGNAVELHVAGRRTGRPFAVLLGLLAAQGHWYVGHPNGRAGWTRNLDAAAGRTRVVWPGGREGDFVARPLPNGPERERAILATVQQPFPGDLIYRLARRHILAVGRYYRLELVEPVEPPPAGV